MACHGDFCLTIYNITATSATLHYVNQEAGDPTPQAYTVYASDGTTVVATGTTSSDPDLDGSTAVVTGLTPATTYVAKLNNYPSTEESFATLTDSPKVATESQWADLANRVKAKSDVVITMTTTDPGEGSSLEENHFIAVYNA